LSFLASVWFFTFDIAILFLFATRFLNDFAYCSSGALPPLTKAQTVTENYPGRKYSALIHPWRPAQQAARRSALSAGNGLAVRLLVVVTGCLCS
jgi:hypothetical protein